MTRLAEVHERVEMERHRFRKEMLKMKMKEEMETEDVKLERKKRDGGFGLQADACRLKIQWNREVVFVLHCILFYT
uniref:Uncharacterized protein n=1 Tax=Aegilops tauschii TaxID=37682 RepID=R7W4P0_AEGTA